MSTIHIIAGPTASGKSSRALELATSKNGRIINCDSIQIYDGLPILTAQPSPQEIQAAPHTLYGHLNPNDPCSAGNWRNMVIPIIEETIDTGQTPIICGGTGLYIKALVNGLSPMPNIPPDIREATNRKQKELGNPAFHTELQKKDPVMAERFHPHHTARLIRAWEVLEATGKSLAEWQKLPPTPPPDHWHFEIEKIMPERDKLYARCNERFIWMMNNGALEETQDFMIKLENGMVKPGVPLTKALGLKQLTAFIKGEISKDEAITLAQAQTRHYAKRQVTWFRNQLQ